MTLPRNLKFFLSHKLYGTRRLKHFDLYQAQPGYWFLEWSSWTLEVEFDSAARRVAATNDGD